MAVEFFERCQTNVLENTCIKYSANYVMCRISGILMQTADNKDFLTIIIIGIITIHWIYCQLLKHKTL